MSESTICVKCEKPKQGGLECPTCGVIYAKAEAALLIKSTSAIGLKNEREKKRRTLGILAVLLVVLAGITSWQVYRTFVIDKTANIIPALPVKDDPNLAHNYIPCAGVAVIDHDRSFTDTSSFNGPTLLDTMDLGQIANYRKAKVRKMAKLNFFHQGYDPFEPPHNRIYGQIVPKVAWVAAVPYYIANPYISCCH